MLGVAYEAPSLATGYGSYVAQVSSIGGAVGAWSCRGARGRRGARPLPQGRRAELALSRLQPLMREAVEKKPRLSQQEARALLERCMRILYYRDARSFNRVSGWVAGSGGHRRPAFGPQGQAKSAA